MLHPSAERHLLKLELSKLRRAFARATRSGFALSSYRYARSKLFISAQGRRNRFALLENRWRLPYRARSLTGKGKPFTPPSLALIKVFPHRAFIFFHFRFSVSRYTCLQGPDGFDGLEDRTRGWLGPQFDSARFHGRMFVWS